MRCSAALRSLRSSTQEKPPPTPPSKSAAPTSTGTREPSFRMYSFSNGLETPEHDAAIRSPPERAKHDVSVRAGAGDHPSIDPEPGEARALAVAGGEREDRSVRMIADDGAELVVGRQSRFDHVEGRAPH